MRDIVAPPVQLAFAGLLLLASPILAACTDSAGSDGTGGAAPGGSGGASSSGTGGGAGATTQGGAGGEGGTTAAGGSGGSGGSGGAGGAAGSCDDPPQPVGQLEDAECMSSWNSQTQTCDVSCDDEANNDFTVRCSNGHCECVYNQQVICGCDADHTNSCQNHCCPLPWKQ